MNKRLESFYAALGRTAGSIGVSVVEGARVDEVEYVLMRTHNPVQTEAVETQLRDAGFRLIPVNYANKHMLVLTSASATPAEQKLLLNPLKRQRVLFKLGRPSTYWYIALDTLGHAMPPPVAPYTIDRMPPSRWAEYWRKYPRGDVDPYEDDELTGTSYKVGRYV